MAAGETWRCAACGAGNAAYRRRCIDCGERRPSEAGAAAKEPGEIPLPRLARRRARSGRRWPTVLGIVAVLALAAYGALSYFGADAPSHDDDLAALREALAGGPDLGAGFQQVVYTESGGGVRSPIFAELTGCDAVDAAALRRREDELLREGGANVTAHLHAVYRDAAGTVVDVRLFAFRTAGIAEVYEALLVGPDVRSCGIHLEAREEVVRTGRSVLVATVGSTFAVVPAPPPAEDVDTGAVLERLAERLEIEG